LERDSEKGKLPPDKSSTQPSIMLGSEKKEQEELAVWCKPDRKVTYVKKKEKEGRREERTA